MLFFLLLLFIRLGLWLLFFIFILIVCLNIGGFRLLDCPKFSQKYCDRVMKDIASNRQINKIFMLFNYMNLIEYIQIYEFALYFIWNSWETRFLGQANWSRLLDLMMISLVISKISLRFWVIRTIFWAHKRFLRSYKLREEKPERFWAPLTSKDMNKLITISLCVLLRVSTKMTTKRDSLSSISMLRENSWIKADFNSSLELFSDIWSFWISSPMSSLNRSVFKSLKSTILIKMERSALMNSNLCCRMTITVDYGCKH